MRSFVLPALVILALAVSLRAQEMIEHHQDTAAATDATYHHSGYDHSGQQSAGQCCEPDVSYCESLWANYCQEKKNCRHTRSPRRSVCGHPACVGGCCGFPFNMGSCRPSFCLPVPSCFGGHRCAPTDCTSAGCSNGDALSPEGGAAAESAMPTAPLPEEATGTGVAPSPSDVDADLLEPPMPVPPAETEAPEPPAPLLPPSPDDSARRWYLPFLRVK